MRRGIRFQMQDRPRRLQYGDSARTARFASLAAEGRTSKEPIMKPLRSILDASFQYVPAVATSVAETWRRAGWRPTTERERKARAHNGAVSLPLPAARLQIVTE
jgi:hypothetical protein